MYFLQFSRVTMSDKIDIAMLVTSLATSNLTEGI